WSDQAMATTSTHDLPPLLGWMQGHDLRLRVELGEQNNLADALQHRAREVGALCQTLGQSRDGQPEAQLDAAVEYVGVTPAPLVLLPLEDALGTEEMVNLPGTLDEHPIWRRRWPEEPSRLFARADVQQRLQRLAAARQMAEKSAQ